MTHKQGNTQTTKLEPADDVIGRATLAALRASCADVCSYAVNGAPGTGCHGECKRGDWGDDEIKNMRVAVKAALTSAANLLRTRAKEPSNG